MWLPNSYNYNTEFNGFFVFFPEYLISFGLTFSSMQLLFLLAMAFGMHPRESGLFYGFVFFPHRLSIIQTPSLSNCALVLFLYFFVLFIPKSDPYKEVCQTFTTKCLKYFWEDSRSCQVCEVVLVAYGQKTLLTLL